MAGHFHCGNNNNTSNKRKKGTVNVAVVSRKGSSDGDSGDNVTTVEDSNTSKLTEDITIGGLLKLTGIINANVGMIEVDGSMYEDDDSWDGDVLANIGVGFCQVQGEKPKKATVINEEWLVQGRRGINPLKVKTKAVKGQKMASSSIKECDVPQAKRHKEKPAWALESCLRGKDIPKVSSHQKARIKECDEDSKIEPSPSKAGNNALPLNNKVAEACARLVNKVILKSKAFEDKSRSVKLSLGGDVPKRVLTIKMGGSTVKTNGESCVLAKSPKPKGEIGNKAQPTWWKMMAKMRSLWHTLDWWKCYLDSRASYHTFLSVSSSRTSKKMGLQ